MRLQMEILAVFEKGRGLVFDAVLQRSHRFLHVDNQRKIDVGTPVTTTTFSFFEATNFIFIS